MGIGVGIFLAAIGAILAFAVDDTVENVDLVAVGYILIAAGAIGVLLDLIVFGPRRREGVAVVEERVYDDPRNPRI